MVVMGPVALMGVMRANMAARRVRPVCSALGQAERVEMNGLSGAESAKLCVGACRCGMVELGEASAG